jgi:hypothetical protein
MGNSQTQEEKHELIKKATYGKDLEAVKKLIKKSVDGKFDNIGLLRVILQHHLSLEIWKYLVEEIEVFDLKESCAYISDDVLSTLKRPHWTFNPDLFEYFTSIGLYDRKLVYIYITRNDPLNHSPLDGTWGGTYFDGLGFIERDSVGGWFSFMNEKDVYKFFYTDNESEFFYHNTRKFPSLDVYIQSGVKLTELVSEKNSSSGFFGDRVIDYAKFSKH